MRPTIFTTVFISLLLAAPLHADDFAKADLNAYLRLHALRLSSDITHLQYLDDLNYFVTQGGGFIGVEANRVGNSDFRNFFFRGVGDPSQLSTLKSVLSQNRVGKHPSCESEIPEGPSSPFEVTWYGKRGRRHSFVVVFAVRGTSGLPPCEPSADEIIRAILLYVQHVTTKPGTEVLVSR